MADHLRASTESPFHCPTVHPLRYSRPVLSLGSCFAVEMTSRLRMHGFQVCQTPYGVLYEPHSCARALEHILQNTESRWFHARGRWHSLSHHTSFSHHSAEEAKRVASERQEEAIRALQHPAPVLILTWGTAVIHRHLDTGQVAANCHSLSPTRFERSQLSVEDIVQETSRALEMLKEQCPQATVLLTISPIRHLAFGSISNLRSKSRLFLAAEALEAHFPWLHYVPAYEFVMDQLRDWHWYAEDGVHLSPRAIDNIEKQVLYPWVEVVDRQELFRQRDLKARLASHPRDPWKRAALYEALLHEATCPPADLQAPNLVGFRAFLTQELERLRVYRTSSPTSSHDNL